MFLLSPIFVLCDVLDAVRMWPSRENLDSFGLGIGDVFYADIHRHGIFACINERRYSLTWRRPLFRRWA